jgi:hypothetical protein
LRSWGGKSGLFLLKTRSYFWPFMERSIAGRR